MRARAGEESAASATTPAGDGGGDGDLPWSVSRYFTRNKKRETDSVGRIVNGEIVAPPGWEDGGGMQLALAVSVAARDAGLGEREVLSRLHQLFILFPDIRERGSLKVGTVVRMCAGPEEGVPARVLRLREALPHVDISLIVSGRPELMSRRGWAQLEREVAAARSLLVRDLGEAAADAFIEKQPDVLDAALLDGALREVRRLFPKDTMQPAERVMRTPSLLYSAESLIGVEAYAPGTDLSDYASRFDT